MRRKGLLFVSLLVFWALNSGHLDWHHHRYLLGAGVVCALFATWISGRMGASDEDLTPGRFLFRCVTYFPWLGLQIVKANVDVAWRVWHPACPIDPSLVTVPCQLKSGFGQATLANSITLTPGTVTVEVGEDTGQIVVHALTREAAAELRKRRMEARIALIEKPHPAGANECRG